MVKVSYNHNHISTYIQLVLFHLKIRKNKMINK